MQRRLGIGLLFLIVIGVGCAKKASTLLSTPTLITPAETAFFSPLRKPALGVDELILFASLRDGYSSIYAVSPDGTVLFRFLKFPEGLRIVGHLDWSPVKRRVAFALAQGTRSDIFVADLMTSELYSITGESTSGGVDPRWSPDGTRLVYVCGEYEPDICVIGSKGEDYAELTSHPARDINPSWSPDGLEIAYQTSRGGLSDIYVLKVDSMTEKDLTRGIGQNARPSWSPDGKVILFQSDRDGSMDIFTISLEGNRVVNLTRRVSLDVDPQWSPDGKFIAFRSDRGGEWDLFVMKHDGSDLVNLTAGWGPVFSYTWSPDSCCLAFVSGRGGNSDICAVNVESGKVIQLTNHPAGGTDPLWISLVD